MTVVRRLFASDCKRSESGRRTRTVVVSSEAIPKGVDEM